MNAGGMNCDVLLWHVWLHDASLARLYGCGAELNLVEEEECET